MRFYSQKQFFLVSDGVEMLNVEENNDIQNIFFFSEESFAVDFNKLFLI